MKYLIFLFLLVVVSCSYEERTCEAFNFSRIPYEQSYYSKSLTYTDGLDTVELFMRHKNYSKNSTWDNTDMTECRPNFEIDYYDENNTVNILYSFDYYDDGINDDNTNFTLHINSSGLDINFDSIQNRINEEIIFDRFKQGSTNDADRLIEKVTFCKMRITSIETYSGTIWRLIKIGDSIYRGNT